jgi:hypothetical protein
MPKKEEKFPKALDGYTNPGVAAPSSGTTGEHADCDQSLGNPDRFVRETVVDAQERDVKKLHDTRNRQLGSNGKRAN